MSILKEIKHAINSTIGTNHFQSLDEMLEPKIIYKYVLDISDPNIDSTDYIIATDWTGKLKVKSYAKGKITVFSYSENNDITCTIKVNNIVKYELPFTYSSLSNKYQVTQTIDINEGDIIEIIAEGCYIDIRATAIITWNHIKNI